MPIRVYAYEHTHMAICVYAHGHTRIRVLEFTVFAYVLVRLFLSGTVVTSTAQSSLAGHYSAQFNIAQCSKAVYFLCCLEDS